MPRGQDGAASGQLSGEGLHMELLPRLVLQPWPPLTCQGFPVLLLPPLPMGGTWPASARSSCPRVPPALLLPRPACQRAPARSRHPSAGVSQKPIPAPHSHAEKAIKASKTLHAKQNTV